MKKRTMFLGLVILLAMSWVFVSPVTAKTTQLSFSIHIPSVGLLGEQYQKWGKMVEERTGGRVKIKYYWSNALMSPKESLSGVATGVADLAIVSGSYNPAELPSFLSWEHAYNASDVWTGVRAVNRMIQGTPVLQKEIEGHGLKYVMPYTSGVFQFFCNGKWAGPADFQGKVIRTMGGARASWYEKLEAKPIFMQINEIYEAVERGTVWGYENTLNLSHILKFYEVTKTMAHLNSGLVMSAFVVINLKKFNSFPEDIQKAISETATDWAENSLARSIIEEEKTLVDEWKKRGVEIVEPQPEDVAMMKKIGRSVATVIAEKQDEKLGTSGEAVGALNGLWREVETAEKELAEKGYPWTR